MKNVLAVLIPNGSTFTRTEMEVLSAAKRIADELGGAMSATILGPVDASWNQSCAGYGASTVYRVSSEALPSYQNDLYTAALRQIQTVANADLILLPSTTYGMEILPVFAYGVGASATMDCVGLKGDAGDGSVTITKTCSSITPARTI